MSARDHRLLDALDALPRTPFADTVWRCVREGRDPVQGWASRARWSDGSFPVLYTSLERDGALAEIHAALSLQPVFPSKPRWRVHELMASANETLHLADMAALAALGIEPATYTGRDYARTQEVAEAANFLGFNGLIAPSARHACLNAVLFTDRLPPDRIISKDDGQPVDWAAWRKTRRA